MRQDVFISGFGGQGALLAGNLLAYAAIIEGRNVSFYPSYGVEKRGGAAMCTVVIADGEVGSPIVGNPSFMIILNQSSLDKYGAKVKPGGVCIVNSSLVSTENFHRSDIQVIEIPMNDMAMDLGDARMVNMIGLGAYVEKSGAVSLSALENGLKEVLPERNHRFIPANIKAIEAGALRARQ
ncbi:2-oxoacid:acceptor oxidoreductase family protein [Geotalea sp. SG265]|uniref:2-oxoacid:acceptor oxidoreductase family protein n=1 Tax=Geotalea sp. SG265 TaxID=2922867 RepID=UPI001FAFF135|nr:2-oxoacid:acceptor oxidoreductase family protein [Geotalea sp. SG265]